MFSPLLRRLLPDSDLALLLLRDGFFVKLILTNAFLNGKNSLKLSTCDNHQDMRIYVVLIMYASKIKSYMASNKFQGCGVTLLRMFSLAWVFSILSSTTHCLFFSQVPLSSFCLSTSMML